MLLKVYDVENAKILKINYVFLLNANTFVVLIVIEKFLEKIKKRKKQIIYVLFVMKK